MGEAPHAPVLERREDQDDGGHPRDQPTPNGREHKTERGAASVRHEGRT
jgi:hypothetical protein